jgi:hypothetical protein
VVKFYEHRTHQTPPLDEATIDHLHSRNDAERGRHPDKEQTVLSCWECNNKRDKEEIKTVPLEELHRRSKMHNSREERICPENLPVIPVFVDVNENAVPDPNIIARNANRRYGGANCK